jgi:uncharacterized protein (TIGR02145 family)
MSRFGLLFLVFMCFGTAFSQIPSYVPTNGLVGWWPFNGNANDESGNGNNGTVNGATLTTDRNGLANKAYSFDGVDDRIEVPSVNGNYQNFSVSLWIRSSSSGQSQQVFFAHSDYTNSSKEIIALTKNSSNLWLGFKQNSNCMAGQGWNGVTGNITSNFNNVWNHLVFVFSGPIKATYLNGNLLAQSSNTGTIDYCSNSNVRFGNYNANYPQWYKGDLDDIGFWNRVLTQQEISNLYNAGPFDVSATTTTICSGQPTTLSVQSVSGTITALNCASATNTGILTAGTVASGVSSSVPYTGGNVGTHNGQTVTSTGVTGLTATLTAGTFVSGNGSLTYTITGTPSTSGTASFALNIGGQTCTLTQSVVSISSQYSSGSVFCASGPTAIVDVTNPTTGKTWMDRNLGASQVATSSTDNAAYGDLYQWGRRSDGHQCRTSLTTSTLSTTDQPINSRFILVDGGDWRNPSNNNLWQGVDGINNPCPNGFKVPTETELNNERLTWLTNNSSGAFSSPLKWTMAGVRNDATGNVTQATTGSYWTSKVIQSDQSVFLTINNSSADISNNDRAYGRSVRCIKN